MNNPDLQQEWQQGDSTASSILGLDEDDFTDFLNFNSNEFSGLDNLSHNHIDNVEQSEVRGSETRMPSSQVSSKASAQYGATVTSMFDDQHQLQREISASHQQANPYGSKRAIRMVPQLHSSQIPPTPNSSEMYASTPQYLNQPILDLESLPHPLHGRPSGDVRVADASHTPIVSPEFGGQSLLVDFQPVAVFTSDLYSMQQMPSPAGDSLMQADATMSHGERSISSSLTASPLALEAQSGPGVPERPRKSRRKAGAVKSPAGSTSSLKTDSGLTNRRPLQTSRVTLPTSSPSVHALRTSRTKQSPVDQLSSAKVAHGSESLMSVTSASMSPQTPVNRSMAPPPKPGVLGTTLDTMHPSQPHARHDISDGLPAATPASIMRLNPRNGSAWRNDVTDSPIGLDQTSSSISSNLEALQLPEAAAESHHTPADGSFEDATPSQRQSRKQDSLNAIPERSNNSSSGVVSPTTPILRDKSGEIKSSRQSKKRNSNSNLVSPALRPKISPSIKPLLPEGADDSILYEKLKNYSNYQNLREGNTLPGVSYPPELSTNLTSKRTSHKIAEQGRRNRMNNALQEMQTLLPSPFNFVAAKEQGSESGERDGSPLDGNNAGANPVRDKLVPSSAGGNTGNSKAATVECAIEYIKHLHKEQATRDAEHARLRDELQRLKADAL